MKGRSGRKILQIQDFWSTNQRNRCKKWNKWWIQRFWPIFEIIHALLGLINFWRIFLLNLQYFCIPLPATLDGMLFWMDYTNTFEWSTQILLNGPHKYFACPHNIPFPQEKPNNTAGHCRETYFGTKCKYIDWVAQIILVWQIKNYFCSSCLPNAMQFQRRYKSKITENTNRWIRRKQLQSRFD